MSNTLLCFPIIGFVRSPLTQKFGIPRQPNLVAIPAVIELLPPYNDPLAFEGIESFSHLWLLWQFHQNKPATFSTEFRPQVRPPRLGGNQKIGVFATRSMYRPANIGLSVVQLDRVVRDKHSVYLHIIGSDMVDGTPIIDIKPYIVYSDSVPNAKSGFAEDKPLVKTVKIIQQVYEKIGGFHLISPKEFDIIRELLAQDPRPAYRQQEMMTHFVMRYGDNDVVFYQSDETTLIWCDILPINTI